MIKILQRADSDSNTLYAGEVAILREDYFKVGEIDTNSLEDAWNRTNSVHTDWSSSTNAALKILGKPGHFRSSQVGDIFVLNGEVNVIMMMGYKQINWGDKIDFRPSASLNK